MQLFVAELDAIDGTTRHLMAERRACARTSTPELKPLVMSEGARCELRSRRNVHSSRISRVGKPAHNPAPSGEPTVAKENARIGWKRAAIMVGLVGPER
jgi:hypothetical protein